jgi:hypothetical protein
LKKNAFDQGSPDAIRALATLPYTSCLNDPRCHEEVEEECI